MLYAVLAIGGLAAIFGSLLGFAAVLGLLWWGRRAEPAAASTG